MTWDGLARYLARSRGVLVGAIGSAVAVALALDPTAGLARSTALYVFWFALTATVLATALTLARSLAEELAARPHLPRAILHRR